MTVQQQQAFAGFGHVVRIVPPPIKSLAISAPRVEQIDIAAPAEILERVEFIGPPHLSGRVTLKHILQETAAKFRISQADIKGPKRNTQYVIPRQLVCYLAKSLTSLNLTQIARFIGNRDHTTILHSVKRTKRRITEEPAFAYVADQVREQVIARAYTPSVLGDDHMTLTSHAINYSTLLQAAYLWRAEYDTATIAQRCGLSEETVYQRMDDIKRIAAQISGSAK